MKIEGFELGEKEMRKQEEYTFSVFLRKLLKAGYPEAKVVLKDFLAYPIHGNIYSTVLNMCTNIL